MPASTQTEDRYPGWVAEVRKKPGADTPMPYKSPGDLRRGMTTEERDAALGAELGADDLIDPLASPAPPRSSPGPQTPPQFMDTDIDIPTVCKRTLRSPSQRKVTRTGCRLQLRPNPAVAGTMPHLDYAAATTTNTCYQNIVDTHLLDLVMPKYTLECYCLSFAFYVAFKCAACVCDVTVCDVTLM